MISRHWKGIVRSAESDNYIKHLRVETFPQLSAIDGFISASILRRMTSAGVEFLIVTRWQSMKAIRRFAGEAVEVAVVPEKAQAMMIEFDREVTHYEVIDSV